MKKTHLATIVAVLCLSTSIGCSQPSTESPGQPEVAITPAALPFELNAPVAADDMDLAFRLLTGPAYDASDDTVTYKIEATNKGKATLASAGTHPVNIGIVIRGVDGTMDTAPATLDFVRVQFPKPLEAGQSIELPVKFEAAPTIGGTVVVDAVQEQVSWFSDHGKDVLALGTFTRCGGAEKTLCLSDGTEVPATQ